MIATLALALSIGVITKLLRRSWIACLTWGSWREDELQLINVDVSFKLTIFSSICLNTSSSHRDSSTAGSLLTLYSFENTHSSFVEVNLFFFCLGPLHKTFWSSFSSVNRRSADKVCLWKGVLYNCMMVIFQE